MKEEFVQVEKKIQEIEEKSSLEFVPVLLDRSARYFYFRMQFAGWGAFLGYELLAPQFPPSWGLLGALVGAVILWEIVSIRAVLSFILPARYKRHKVELSAQRLFLREEVFNTPQRSGILILVSRLERAVYVMADKGFDGKVTHAEWAELGVHLAQDFSKKRMGEIFIKALDELSDRLVSDFPGAAVGANRAHLKNTVREE